MTFLKTIDNVKFELIPATEKAEIEKAGHRIKEIVTYMNKISKYSECARACVVIRKIQELVGKI